MLKSVRLSRMLAALTITALLAAPALAWPPGGNGGGGGGNGGGGNGGGGGGPSLPVFEWISLGSLGGDPAQSVSWAMNNDGEVVGDAKTADGETHAFLNSPDGAGGRVMIDLHDLMVAEGHLPPFDDVTGTGVIVHRAHDVNDAGQIVGFMREYDQGLWVDEISYRYSPPGTNGDGSPSELALITDAGEGKLAINNLGVVAGLLSPAQPYTWDETGGIQTFPPVPGWWTRPSAINDSGQICGTLGNGQSAFRYTPGEGYDNMFGKDPYRASAPDLNEFGQVVGSLRKSIMSSSTTYVFDDSGLTTFKFGGIAASSAIGINNWGDILGEAYFGEDWRPYLYTEAHGLIEISQQSVALPAGVVPRDLQPVTINDAGEIVMNTIDIMGSRLGTYLVVPLP